MGLSGIKEVGRKLGGCEEFDFVWFIGFDIVFLLMLLLLARFLVIMIVCWYGDSE